MFMAVYRSFYKIGNIVHILAWKSKRFSDESIKLSATSGNTVAPSLNHIVFKTKSKFDG